MGIVSKIRDKADDKIDAVLDIATAKCQSGYYEQWMEYCGVKTKEEIDYTVPCVELESKLCDPRNLKMIKNGKHTEDFLKLLSSDQARELYYYKDEEGKSLSDLEHPWVFKAICDGIAGKLKGPFKKVFKKWAETD